MEQSGNVSANSIEIMYERIPMKEISITDRDKQWLTPLIKLLINDRWRAYRMRNWSLYNHLKAKVKNEIVKAKRSWANKLQSCNYGVWNLAKHVSNKTRKVNLSSLVSQFGSNEALAVALADHFEKIATNQVVKDNSLNTRSNEHTLSVSNAIMDLSVSEEEVKRLLDNAPFHKAPGCDGIPNTVYSSLSGFIAKPLALIYEASFAQSKYPSRWKKGIVVPIPKKRMPSVADVRPITLHPLPSKICEQIVKKNYISFFEDSYGVNQHSFRRGASTTTALIQIIDACLKNFDDSSSSGNALLCLDLSKAFDSLNHTLILKKMKENEFPVGLISWIWDYLQNRSAQVKIGCNLSQNFPIQRGVPQGTVLGPLIFNLFVSDFRPFLSSSVVVKYADDMSIVVRLTSKNTDDIKQTVETEIAHAKSWCSQNGLIINSTKSSVLISARNPSYVPDSFSFPKKDDTKILGVRINSNLDWSSHIEDVYKKSNQRFHVLKKIKPLVTPEDLHKIYIAYIRSILDYCAPVFVKLPNKLAKRLQAIDKRAHRIIFHDNDRTCECISIGQRREFLSLKLLGKIESSEQHILHHMLPHRLHHTKKFNITCCRTNKRYQSFISYVTRLVNDL